MLSVEAVFLMRITTLCDRSTNKVGIIYGKMVFDGRFKKELRQVMVGYPNIEEFEETAFQHYYQIFCTNTIVGRSPEPVLGIMVATPTLAVTHGLTIK